MFCGRININFCSSYAHINHSNILISHTNALINVFYAFISSSGIMLNDLLSRRNDNKNEINDICKTINESLPQKAVKNK
jgi:hypothetical protein